MSLSEQGQYFIHLCYLHDLAPWWWKIDFAPSTKYAVINVMEQQTAEDIGGLCLRWACRTFKCSSKYYITVKIKVNTSEDLKSSKCFFLLHQCATHTNWFRNTWEFKMIFSRQKLTKTQFKCILFHNSRWQTFSLSPLNSTGIMQ